MRNASIHNANPGRRLAGPLCLLGVVGALMGPPLAAVASDAAIKVPSGQKVVFLDMIIENADATGAIARFRFVSPQIARNGGNVRFMEAEPDMAFLCDTYALPRLAETGQPVTQIVISLSDRAVAFGEADPDATQFFEGYRPGNGACDWDGF